MMVGGKELRRCQHYVILFVDHTGDFCTRLSPSLAKHADAVISSGVKKTFLDAVAKAEDLHPFSSFYNNHLPIEWKAEQTSQYGSKVESPRQQVHGIEEDGSIVDQEYTLSVRNQYYLRQYYEKAFRNLQQINCRALAKAWIKLVEPQKQVNYPYNGRKLINGSILQLDPSQTTPPWWPSGVSYKEPDHLLKPERIQLLIHLLCNLSISHGITAQKLRKADRPIRRQISSEGEKILDEVYQVRHVEETHLDGAKDGPSWVSISRANLPDTSSPPEDSPEISLNSGPIKLSTNQLSAGGSTHVKAMSCPDMPPEMLFPRLIGPLSFDGASLSTNSRMLKPYLVGHNANEAGFYKVAAYAQGSNLDDQDWWDFNNDTFFCPSNFVAADRTSYGVLAWRFQYNADWNNTRLYPGSGAYHGVDMNMLFGKSAEISGIPNSNAQQVLQAEMRKAWAAFVTDPADGLTTLGWPTYDRHGTTIAEIGLNNKPTVSFSSHRASQRCGFST